MSIKTPMVFCVTAAVMVAGVARVAGAQQAKQSNAAAPAGTAAQSNQDAAAKTQSNQNGTTKSQAASHPAIEQQRQQAKERGDKTLDKEAISAIEQTRQAAKAIAAGKTDEAINFIQQAIGQIDVLVARHPAAALLPVELEVEIIDLAPADVEQAKALAETAEEAVRNRDFPEARVLLEQLTSEMRVRTRHLPLATYPVALREAARLLDQQKSDVAAAALATALNTLVIIDRVTPLPVSLAQIAVDEAQKTSQQDKGRALQYIAVAKQQLERAKALGYAGNDPEYLALNQAATEVEQQLRGDQDSGGAFAKLKEKIASFFSRQSEAEKKAAAGGGQGPRVTRRDNR